MIELDSYEQQIILACKGWGKWSEKEDRYKAVKVVIAQYYGFDLENLEIRTIYHCMTELFFKINQNNIWYYQRFIEKLFQDNWTGIYHEQINRIHIIKNIISEISLISVLDENKQSMFNQLEPDYEILNKGIKEE